MGHPAASKQRIRSGDGGCSGCLQAATRRRWSAGLSGRGVKTTACRHTGADPDEAGTTGDEIRLLALNSQLNIDRSSEGVPRVRPPVAQQNRRTHYPQPGSPIIARFSRSFLARRPSLRSLSMPMQRRKMAFLAMHEVSHRARRPAMIDGPPFTMSRRIPSTCPMERDWKRIRASTTGWTIRVTSTNECAGRR